MAQIKRKRPKIGDIIEIKTPKGLAYAQYTHKHDKPPKYGALIRVLPGLYKTRPTDFSKLVQEMERFFVFFPLNSAITRGIVTIVAHEEVPERCRDFPIFRDGVKNPQTGRVETWWLWDGEREWKIGKLKPEHYKLPIRAIWNDTLLIKRIIDNWAPEDEV